MDEVSFKLDKVAGKFYDEECKNINLEEYIDSA